ncbi:hypothetical protein EIP86_001990 [Pleurotus ostreatoroseus]|nr:hypothetical protein EIP86_001990 [Pleurotus ostreatoroseus]
MDHCPNPQIRTPCANPMALTNLNEDVLQSVFLLLSVKRLLALMSTCRILFRTGLPALLGRPHRIKEQNLQSFHDFLERFAPTSFTSLLDLDFDGVQDTAQLGIIAAILVRTTSLQDLRIDLDTDFSSCRDIEQENALIQALAALSTLRYLRLRGEGGFFTLPCLTQSHAPLVHLQIRMGIIDKVLPLLVNFADTLESVELYYLSLSKVAFRCPRVTHLSLWSCEETLLPILFAIFPNVEVLSINSGCIEGPWLDGDFRSIKKIRDESISLQESQRWDSLVSLAVDPMAIYILGIQRELPSVVMPLGLDFSSSYECASLRMAFESLRPQHLQLGICVDPTYLGAALGMGMDRLDRLDLRIELRSDSPPDFADRMLNALGSLKIYMLHCIFYNDAYLEDDRAQVDEMIEGLNARELASKAMNAAPRLKFARFDVGSGRRSSYWFIPEDAEGNRQLREITQCDPDILCCINCLYLPFQVQDDNYYPVYWDD